MLCVLSSISRLDFWRHAAHVMKQQIHYDIIGDIHGRFDKLTALMARLGYASDGEAFLAPTGHCALFLGDLIDPKPGHSHPGGVRATLRAVKTMCDRGDALCLMGNHELNALYYHSKGPDGKWLRHHGDKNVAMHQGTLDDFPDHADAAGEWQGVWLPWLKALPIWLELDGLRAVHAAWHPEMIARLAGGRLADPEFFLGCANKNNPLGEAIEILLKGIEVPLPDGQFFTDHTGTKRAQFRARWWEAPNETLFCNELVFPPCGQIQAVPVDPAVYGVFTPYPADAPPVFFGHYLKPAKSPLEPEGENVACLDFSAAKEGPLVAYRWQGETTLKPERYVVHEDTPDLAAMVDAMRIQSSLARGIHYTIDLVTCTLDDQNYARVTVEETSAFSDYELIVNDFVPLSGADLDEIGTLTGLQLLDHIQQISAGRNCILTCRGNVSWGGPVFYPHT